jgi:hypothetical protein
LTFCHPAEPPPSFNQEKDSYHEEVAAEDFGMVEDFGFRWNSLMKISFQKTLHLFAKHWFRWRWRRRKQDGQCFIELGFNKTMLVNTTGKDIPKNVEEDHVVLIPR